MDAPIFSNGNLHPNLLFFHHNLHGKTCGIFLLLMALIISYFHFYCMQLENNFYSLKSRQNPHLVFKWT